MALGVASQQLDLLDPVTRFCDEALPANSIFAFLHEHRETLFPDGLFTDLFAAVGRRSVPPSVVATVMVLQRLEGLSDREAVDRFTFDARWRYAAGVGGWDGEGRVGFAHTVLVDMRERLRRSGRPDRVFEVALDAARAAGLLGRRRVLDSTPLYDAVATMDTITLIRSAIRGLLAAAGDDLAARLWAALTSGDDYTTTGKPVIDWDDQAARDGLVDSRARDGDALLSVVDGQDLPGPVGQAMRLLATVLGQDLETADDGVLRIARKVACDRVISTVDPEARHGHKTSHRGFDGYKGHVAVDPGAELITATAVTAGNTGDAEPVADLIGDLTGDLTDATESAADTAAVYGDAAYGAGEVLDHLHTNGIDIKTKVQPPNAPAGKFTKDRFDINLTAATVTCPNGVTVAIRPVTGQARHAGKADFGPACATCPLRGQCTDSKTGRRITIGHHEARLAAARIRQSDPAWQADYRATRLAGRLPRHPPGRPITAPPAPRSNARSPTWCAAGTAADAPACAAEPASPPTSPCWPPRSTSPDSPPSASPTPAAAGRSTPPDPDRGKLTRRAHQTRYGTAYNTGPATVSASQPPHTSASPRRTDSDGG